MKKRVFGSIFLACLITLLLTAGFIINIMYTNSTAELHSEVKAEATYIMSALNTGVYGDSYLAMVGKASPNRITLISGNGTVLFDNFASVEAMENHADRPEVAAAAADGVGEETRLSDTLGKQTYYYAVALDNGDILRIASTSQSVLGLLGSALVWIFYISIFVMIAASLIAHFLTKKVTQPLNDLDLEDPLSNVTYEELSPLLNRMEKQNRKIKYQVKKLSEKRAELEFITSNMREGLVIFNSDGNILSANKSALKIFGTENPASYLELCRDENYFSAVRAALAGTSSSAKMQRGGNVYQLSASSIQAESTSYAAVLFAVDVTDSEQSEAMRREFSANVSHELKTPLQSIMGCAEIIGNGISKTDDIPDFANQIHSEASRLLALIEDIIKLSQLDEGNLKQEFEEVNLSEVCRDVVSRLADKAKGNGISLNYIGEKAVIDGFSPVLHEMVFNLCDNAIRYNKPGGSVEINLSEKNSEIVLSVSDTGIGIPPEHQSRVFERFYRVDKSHSKETGGTGLGLSIVKHGAALHGAELELESEVGKGTVITLVFRKQNAF